MTGMSSYCIQLKGHKYNLGNYDISTDGVMGLTQDFNDS